MSTDSHKVTRGVRNKNPLNIRVGCQWLGETPVNTDGSFEQFTSMLWGLRAGFILIKRYINRYNCNTIAKIISRWAPPSENRTNVYIDFVAREAGYPADKVLTFDDVVILDVVRAMCRMESDFTPADDVLKKAYGLARGV